MLGREGVCIELESDLFLIDKAAEGRCITILTRALQLVPATTTLLGDLRHTLISFLLRNGRKSFSPTLVFLPSRFDQMHSLLTSFTDTSDDGKSAKQARPKEPVYKPFVFVRRWFILERNKPFAKEEPFRKNLGAVSWQGCVVLKFTSQN